MKYHNHGFGTIAAGLITLCIILIIASCATGSQHNSNPASTDFSKVTAMAYGTIKPSPSPRPQSASTPKPAATPRPSSKPKATAKPESTPKPSDPYDVYDYSHPDDFYYDHYDDFWDYEDAEDYYDAHQ